MSQTQETTAGADYDGVSYPDYAKDAGRFSQTQAATTANILHQ